MIIQAVDQLVCIDETDSYAASMGMLFPTDGGNAQYYNKQGDTVTEVSPQFSDASNKRLIFFPQIFSAVGNSYLTPGANDVFTFRINNISSDAAIIARGTPSTFAIVNGSTAWSTAAQGKAQTRSQVFKAMTYTFNGITVPALAIIGDPAYGTQADMQIYCTCEFENGSVTCKGDMEIRPMGDSAFKAVITAVSSIGGNDQVIDTSTETITLTASLLKNGSANGISGATFKWWRLQDKDSTDVTKILGTSATLQVTEGLVNGHEEFVVGITYGGATYYASITINDIQDQWTINKGRVVYADSTKASTVENSNVIKEANVVDYTPTVVDSHTGAAYSGAGTWSYTFTVRNNAGTVIYTSTPVSLPYTILGSVVKSNGGLNVHISASNSSI